MIDNIAISLKTNNILKVHFKLLLGSVDIFYMKFFKYLPLTRFHDNNESDSAIA